ncbi:MAG TPA: hypothetical protein VD998_03415 [Verrucomicrobiae bacterium]|nr:hypothetical protein [Verrucomicrobiae bacterium]
MPFLFSQQKQKTLSIIIISSVTFLGFETLSAILGQTYQLKIFAELSIYLYFFQIFWLTFIYDLHLKKRDILRELRQHHSGWSLFVRAFKERLHHIHRWQFFRHYLNFLILPGVIYWSAIILLSLNPFHTELKQVVIILATLSLSVAYWHLKEVFSKNFEMHHFGIKILALVKILAVYLFYCAIVGYTFYFGHGPVFLSFFVFAVTSILLYQALFQHKLLNLRLMLIAMVIALVTTGIAFWIYQVWNHNYFTGALIILAVYNAGWGILHHYLDNNLTKKLAIEYLFMMFLVVSILLASHDFTPRIQ